MYQDQVNPQNELTAKLLLSLRTNDTKALGLRGTSGVEGGDFKMTFDTFADPHTVNALIETDTSE